MSGGSSAEILVLSNMQAKALAGSVLAIGGEVFRLKDYDPAYPGQPPWRSGAEGKAYPLLARNGSVAAYLKFFTRPTPQRLDRTAWLIGQQMQTWLPGLVAAPLMWIDTRLSPHAGAIDFDFAGYLAQAVPGETWLELKNRIVEKGVALAEEFRWRCVADLVLATAVLERAGIVHGDLSPNNIVVDPGAAAGEPALYLIDFDAFVAAAAGRNRSIDVAGGGTFGTGGYCPPDLAARAAAGDGSAAPYSDRYGRDMLMLELLLMDHGLPPDDPASAWRREEFERRRAAWRANSAPLRPAALAHLNAAEVFSLAEERRPTSQQLASAMGLELPEPPEISAGPPLASGPSAILGIRAVSARVEGRRQRKPAQPPRPRPHVQNRPAARAAPPTLNQWLISAQVVPHKHRRMSPRGPVPRDTLGTKLLMAAFIALLLLPLLIPSCLSTMRLGRSFENGEPRRAELVNSAVGGGTFEPRRPDKGRDAPTQQDSHRERPTVLR